MIGSTTLRCWLLGHRCRYDVIVDTETESIVDAECKRRGCEYEKRLDDEWRAENDADESPQVSKQ